MRRYPAAATDAPLFVFAHGAGAGEQHPWMQRVANGLSAGHGISVVTFEFPYMQAKRKRPDQGSVLEDAFRDVWLEIAGTRPPGTNMFAGGKSMGGRIASHVAANGNFAPAPTGLLFFGYPLHPPGAPAKRRDRHLPKIDAPMLFLHGTRDPFGEPAEMQPLIDSLPRASLHLIDGGDHSLQSSRRDGPDGRSVQDAIDVAAAWIWRHARG
jgi:predicted alpha/beta-hydrolase family hydrolase